MADLSVVIVTFNNSADIGACLDSVAAIDPPAADVVVVDNASDDNTVARAQEHALRPTVIANDGNEGFGRGVNRGAAAASGDHLLLLNPDAVLRPGAVQLLLAQLEDRQDVAMAGGLTEFTDGGCNPFTVRRLPSLRSLVVFATGLSALSSRIPDFERLPLPEDDEVRSVPMLTGSLMLVPRPVWEELGGFDERFFMYAEDTDLCARMLDSGRQILLVPAARIVHDGGASTPDSGRKTAMMLAGRATYIRLRWRGPRRMVGLALLQAGVAVRALLARVRPGAMRWRAAWGLRSWWSPGYGEGRPVLPPT